MELQRPGLSGITRTLLLETKVVSTPMCRDEDRNLETRTNKTEGV